MDGESTQVDTQVVESEGEELTCVKCQQKFPEKLIVKKSKNFLICRPCCRLSCCVSNLKLPEGFSGLSSNDLVDFYKGVKDYVDQRTGRLVHDKVSQTVVQTLEKSTESSKQSCEGGEFLPLSVQVMRGWDPELVQSAGVYVDHPTLGPVYKMQVLSEQTAQTTSLKREETTTVNLKAKRGAKALKAAPAAAGSAAAPETEEDLGLLSDAEEEFKKNTAAASKAVAELLPLFAKVSEETRKSSKDPELLQEAQNFLAQGSVGASLSFEALHVSTEATLLKNSLAAAKPKRAAAKKAAKEKTEPQEAEG
ncbi:unnamed protein product [Symbiodinium microadriaticum]|nr:unnamed protein product [Symbiodinium microadriaticum]